MRDVWENVGHWAVAEAVTSMLDGVSLPPTPHDPDRGWEAQLATTGPVRINLDGSYANRS